MLKTVVLLYIFVKTCSLFDEKKEKKKKNSIYLW